MPPAARITDMHVCPMVTGIVPHVGGPILPPGAPTVLIDMLPAATVTTMAVCVGPPDMIVMGSMTVLINFLPAARMLDPTVHGGVIMMGSPTCIIGEVGIPLLGLAGLGGIVSGLVASGVGPAALSAVIPSLNPASVLQGVANAASGAANQAEQAVQQAAQQAQQAAEQAAQAAQQAGQQAQQAVKDVAQQANQAVQQGQQALQQAQQAVSQAAAEGKAAAQQALGQAQQQVQQCKQAAAQAVQQAQQQAQQVEQQAQQAANQAKHAAQQMVARGSGRILITASIAGTMPTPYHAVYGATKAFLLEFSLQQSC